MKLNTRSNELNKDYLIDSTLIAFSALRQIQILRAKNMIKDANAIILEWLV